jgi:hypothetical protein
VIAPAAAPVIEAVAPPADTTQAKGPPPAAAIASPPVARVVPPPLPAAYMGNDDTIALDDDLDTSDDETPTGTDISVPDVAFPRRLYGPVVDLSRPTVPDLEQPPPLPLTIVARERYPVALARREPIVLQAHAGSGSLPTRQLARRPVSVPSMPLALMKPHVRIAKSLAHDVRSSKREIVIGLSIGLILAAPLFIAGHLYLQHRSRAQHGAAPERAATTPRSAAHAGVSPQPLRERPRSVVPGGVVPGGVAPPTVERIQQAVAGLEPGPAPVQGSAVSRSVPPRERSSALSGPASAAGQSATLAPKSPRRRAKASAAPSSARQLHSNAVEEPTAAQGLDADEPELSPAERAGLTTTIPF